MVAPSSRFSNSAFTGTRVPLKTHAPLTFSGERSTAGHEVQSSITETVIGARLRGNTSVWRTRSLSDFNVRCWTFNVPRSPILPRHPLGPARRPRDPGERREILSLPDDDPVHSITGRARAASCSFLSAVSNAAWPFATNSLYPAASRKTCGPSSARRESLLMRPK